MEITSINYVDTCRLPTHPLIRGEINSLITCLCRLLKFKLLITQLHTLYMLSFESPPCWRLSCSFHCIYSSTRRNKLYLSINRLPYRRSPHTAVIRIVAASGIRCGAWSSRTYELGFSSNFQKEALLYFPNYYEVVSINSINYSELTSNCREVSWVVLITTVLQHQQVPWRHVSFPLTAFLQLFPILFILRRTQGLCFVSLPSASRPPNK